MRRWEVQEGDRETEKERNVASLLVATSPRAQDQFPFPHYIWGTPPPFVTSFYKVRFGGDDRVKARKPRLTGTEAGEEGRLGSTNYPYSY